MIQTILRNKYILLSCLLACVAYQFLFINRAHVDVTIQVEKRTFFKIYWAGEGQGFSESRMARIWVTPERKKYSFFLTDLRDVILLRLDPQQYVGSSTIEELRITQIGLGEINLSSLQKDSRLKPLSQVKTYAFKDNILEVQSSGKDPNFSYEVNQKARTSVWTESLFGFAVIICCILLINFLAKPLVENSRYIPAMLLVVLTLTLAMAAMSENDAHPDEFTHMLASNYYKEHWLPPPVDAESIRNTYSQYGASRLNTDEIYYLLNGKFARSIAPLRLSETTALRLFNVVLLGIILLYTLRFQDARLVAAPLLISAQAWYQFSYCNSEAFALAVTFLVGCQIVMPESALNTYLFGAQERPGGASALWLILLFGLLFLLKKNFAFFTALAFLLILVAIWQTTEREKRLLAAKRFCILCLLSLSLLAVKKGADISINGFDRHKKILQMRDEIALPMFNLSSPVKKMHHNLAMKKKGYSLERLINKERWFEKTFRSAFGVYGYATISGGFVYYDLVRYTGIAFLVFFFASIFFKAGLFGRLETGSALAMALALIAMSFYHSWVKDFQAQGRYLLPILPMLGIICARHRAYLNVRMLTFFMTCMFLLGVYSFLWVALVNIPPAVSV